MSYLRARKAVLLAKAESTEGTEVTPSASTDAVAIENLQFTPQLNVVNTNEHSDSLDGFGSIAGGILGELGFDVPMKGSGAAGTAPEVSDLLKACGLAETITSTAVPASAEACGAGGSTTTAELGASAGTTAQQYRGMPITFSSEVAGSSFISNYTTGKIATLTDTFAAIDADTNYQIPVNVLYRPASTSIQALTFNFWFDGLKHVLLGGRGTVSFSIDTAGIGRWTFRFRALLKSTFKSDVSNPTPTLDSTRPQVFRNGKFKINRAAAAIQNFAVDFGNTLINPHDPNQVEGYDATQITGRNITFSMNPAETLVATRDIFADLRAGTTALISASYGSAAGNRIGIVIPQAGYLNEAPADRDGILAKTVTGECRGQDAGVFICFY